jgi:hypothetical protein
LDYVSDMDSSTGFNTRHGPPEISSDLHHVAQLVHQEFDDRLDPRAIDECLATVAATYADAKVRSFVPLLVRRYVREELHARL